MSHARAIDAASSTAGPEQPGTDSTVTSSPAPGLGLDSTFVGPRRADTATPSGGSVLPLVDPTRYAVAGELAHGGIGRILRTGAWPRTCRAREEASRTRRPARAPGPRTRAARGWAR